MGWDAGGVPVDEVEAVRISQRGASRVGDTTTLTKIAGKSGGRLPG
jgi:hypothetical protein